MEKAQGVREAAIGGGGHGDSDSPVTCGFPFCVLVLKQSPKSPGGRISPFLSSLLFILLFLLVSFCLLFSPFTENLQLSTA